MVPAACTGARVPLFWKAPTCFPCSCESVGRDCRPPSPGAARGGGFTALLQESTSARRTFSSGTEENGLLAAGRTLCPQLCHPGVSPVLAWLSRQWGNSPSGKAGGTTGPASVLALHVTGLMGQWKPHPDPPLGAPQPLFPGNHRVWPESWLGQDFKVDVISPAEWAQSGPQESWVWCPASWPGSRGICSLCAQLSVCARNLVPQGLPSEFPVPGCSPESFGDRPGVLHLRREPAGGLRALFPAVQEDYPLL